MNAAQLVQAIKVHIGKGDKAKDKAEQHYIAAGQHLKSLKAQHCGTWAEWEDLLKAKIGIGKSRASELMQIADGTKTVETLRAEKAESVRAVEQRKKISPLASGENAADDSPSPSPEEEKKRRDDRVAALVRQARDNILSTATDREILEKVRPPMKEAWAGDLAEKLHAAEIKIEGLEDEIEGLKRENAELRTQLAALDDGIPESLRRAPRH